MVVCLCSPSVSLTWSSAWGLPCALKCKQKSHLGDDCSVGLICISWDTPHPSHTQLSQRRTGTLQRKYEAKCLYKYLLCFWKAWNHKYGWKCIMTIGLRTTEKSWSYPKEGCKTTMKSPSPIPTLPWGIICDGSNWHFLTNTCEWPKQFLTESPSQST